MNPFDLAGAQFLTLYVAAIAVGIGAVFVVRLLIARGDGAGAADVTLDPYEAACLAGGPARRGSRSQRWLRSSIADTCG